VKKKTLVKSKALKHRPQDTDANRTVLEINVAGYQHVPV